MFLFSKKSMVKFSNGLESQTWTKFHQIQHLQKKFMTEVHRVQPIHMKNIVQIIVEVIVIVVMRNGTMSMISQQMPVEEMEGMVDQLEYFLSVEHLDWRQSTIDWNPLVELLELVELKLLD